MVLSNREYRNKFTATRDYSWIMVLVIEFLSFGDSLISDFVASSELVNIFSPSTGSREVVSLYLELTLKNDQLTV